MPHINILALDTATEACSAALSVNGLVTEIHEIAPRRHAELILGMVDKLLADAGLRLGDLAAIAFGCGPGAFTGLRVAAGVTQGLAFGANLPVVPISTLATLAQGAAATQTQIISAIDARMREIYWGMYRAGPDGLVLPVMPDALTPPGQIALPPSGRWYGVGTGWQTYGDILSERLGDSLAGYTGERYPLAADMIPLALRDLKLGKTVPADQALPVYLRDKVTS
ncbi:MAG TPA: tRNA (adenosine(37)-N6)-threonylcarbamoyltransferase complex dimerization subunit type 1 TsaB [Gammaproteobacteria bacterium]|nr:tRNA (adenosine(37)-N6)-threonylcarbamoyltransferase complex dimerization subunit type 1 TsaB [Gammaproteobacteria bacterium]